MQRFLHICFSPQKTKKLLMMKICFAPTNLFYLFYFIILPHTMNYKQNKNDNK